jgi:hypothetical protein
MSMDMDVDKNKDKDKGEDKRLSQVKIVYGKTDLITCLSKSHDLLGGGGVTGHKQNNGDETRLERQDPTPTPPPPIIPLSSPKRSPQRTDPEPDPNPPLHIPSLLSLDH